MGVGRRIKGIGPLDARLMIIAEYPSREEARTGVPFSPRRGRENDIDRFFDGVRLPQRDECWFTYLVREWCGDDADYIQSDYDRDLPDLLDEIRAVQPEVIVALGREVNRLFLGDIDVDETHACAWYLPVNSQCADIFMSPAEVVIFTTYNPAAGFKSPELSAKVTYDFQQLESYLNGELTARVLYDDPHPNPVYRLITGDEVCRVLQNL